MMQPPQVLWAFACQTYSVRQYLLDPEPVQEHVASGFPLQVHDDPVQSHPGL